MNTRLCSCHVTYAFQSGFGFESSCSHFTFRFRTCFKQGVPRHSGNYKVWIHSETRMWHDKNIQSNALHRQVLRTQLNHLVSMVKWLSVLLRTKWFWVRVQLQADKRLTLSNCYYFKKISKKQVAYRVIFLQSSLNKSKLNETFKR